MALGSPDWVAVGSRVSTTAEVEGVGKAKAAGGLFSESSLREVTVTALEAFLLEVRAIDCDTSVFRGVSGRRIALIPLLEEVKASCSSGPK